jgi:DNA-directed RNA polymerase II subunit RPB1
VEVTTDKTNIGGKSSPNGVFDDRFGVIRNGERCKTCHHTNQFCPGHFGHIRMARPVYLYQFFETVEKLVNIICLNCSKLIPNEEDIKNLTSEGLTKFAQIRDLIKDKKILSCPHCNTALFKKIAKKDQTVATLEGEPFDEEAEKIVLQPEMILRAFQRITDEDCDLIGLNSKYARPDWMVCTVLAVPPLTVRPTVIMDDNQRAEDDLTYQLVMIVRSNNSLQNAIDKNESADTINKLTSTLQYMVATYVDNEIKGFPAASQRSGRPLKTLKSRFGAKKGRVRGNLMGKRVDFSARSVITPDATIELDELGVPEEIARNLTFPEVVNQFNRDRLTAAIRNGPNVYPGAKTVHPKLSNKSISLQYVKGDTIDLHDGDIVDRHMVKGDIVLFNRQPSLHKGSMEAHRVVVLPYSTFRLNVSATRPYNAD